MSNRIYRVAILLAVTGILTCTGEETKILRFQDSDWGEKHRILIGQTCDFLNPGWEKRLKVAPPPANDSTRTRAEIGEILQLQASRTLREQREIDFEKSDSAFKMLNTADVETLDEKPLTAALITRLNRDATIVVMTFKDRFRRVRPAVLDALIKPSVETPSHPAYPSAHATLCRVMAHVLADLNPERKDRLFKIGNNIARRREVAGVHYPSDSAAGQNLGDQIYQELLLNEHFRKTLERIRKAEWAEIRNEK